MSQNENITVVVILSLAYSGTTWFTLVCGSHDKTICLGAGDRIRDSKNGDVSPDSLCLLHGNDCDLWPEFFQKRDKTGNVLKQIAQETGKRVLVINNPSRKWMEEDFYDEGIDLKPILFVRNGPAALASAMRHHPERVDNVFQSAMAWLYRGTETLKQRMQNTCENPLYLRYEECVSNPEKMLAQLSDYIGVDYSRKNLRYWDFNHHLPSGNQGTLDTLIRLQGGQGLMHKRKAYYDDMVRYLLETDGIPKLDESWRETYSEVDLAALDFACGKQYEELGFSRLEYSDQAKEDFFKIYQPTGTHADILKEIQPWRRDIIQTHNDKPSFSSRIFGGSPTIAQLSPPKITLKHRLKMFLVGIGLMKR